MKSGSLRVLVPPYHREKNTHFIRIRFVKKWLRRDFSSKYGGKNMRNRINALINSKHRTGFLYERRVFRINFVSKCKNEFLLNNGKCSTFIPFFNILAIDQKSVSGMEELRVEQNLFQQKLLKFLKIRLVEGQSF